MPSKCRLEVCEHAPRALRGCEYVDWKFKGDLKSELAAEVKAMGIGSRGSASQRAAEMRGFLKSRGFEMTGGDLVSWTPVVTVEKWKRP